MTTSPPRPAERTTTPGDQRSRILDVALAEMSEHGAAGTSMRKLAGACGLNVATLYHYFPSKADLLQAVIAERRYGDRLARETPPIEEGLSARDRLAALFRWLWEQTKAEEQILRLIVGEGLHGDETARRSARALIAAVDRWLTDVLVAAVPELTETGIPGSTAARLLRRQLIGLIAQHLATGSADSDRAADELAAALLPEPAGDL